MKYETTMAISKYIKKLRINLDNKFIRAANPPLSAKFIN